MLQLFSLKWFSILPLSYNLMCLRIKCVVSVVHALFTFKCARLRDNLYDPSVTLRVVRHHSLLDLQLSTHPVVILVYNSPPSYNCASRVLSCTTTAFLHYMYILFIFISALMCLALHHLALYHLSPPHSHLTPQPYDIPCIIVPIT